MSTYPLWLPAIVPFHGYSEEFVQRLYEYFSVDFKQGPLFIDKMIVFYDRKKKYDREKKRPYPYEEGFYHLIERENKKTKIRYFEECRAVRIRWCRSCIVNIHQQEILYWHYKESKNRTSIYLWLCYFDYVVVFDLRMFRKGPVAFLKSAHCVDQKDKRRKLMKKFENRFYP